MLAPDTLLENRYRIIRDGARFSIYVTYEAVDERLGGEVTLREWATGGTEASREAFIREAQLLHAVFQLGLPYVSDLFESEGSWYSVSQAVPGQTLSATLGARGAPFRIQQVWGWIERILSVLEFFHTLSPSIVVATVSPQSIHVTPRNDALLTDVGLAVEQGEVSIGYSMPYAPIEQIQGSVLDPSADVYALGATMYQMLTLHAPPTAQQRNDGLGGSGTAVLRSVEDINSSVSPEVARVIYRAMAVRSEERYPSAVEMHAALNEAMAEAGSTWRLRESRDATSALTVDEMDTTEVASVPPGAPVAQPAPESKGPRTSVVCRQCGSVNDAEQKFCPRCGGALKKLDLAGGMEDPDVAAAYNGATETIKVGDPKGTLELAMARGAADDEGEHESTEDLPRQRAFLHVLEGEDPGAILELSHGKTLIGRATGTYTFPLDIFMSGRHTTIERRDAKYVLIDEDSRNGTFVRLRSSIRLEPGDTILVGKQLLRFERDERSGKPVIGLVRKTGSVGQFYDLRNDEMVVGRTRGDINFPDDSSMAEQHVRITVQPDGHYVTDCGTKNGTFIRLRAEVELMNGDVIIIGKHIFRFELLRPVEAAQDEG